MDPKSSLLRVKDDVTGAVSVEAKPLTMLTVLLLISHSFLRDVDIGEEVPNCRQGHLPDGF